jgi:hypothetical protein
MQRVRLPTIAIHPEINRGEVEVMQPLPVSDTGWYVYVRFCWI